jgi:hypothetical protein
MTKFEELCNAVVSGHETALKHKEMCTEFATELVRGFAEYLQIPASKYRLIPSGRGAITFLQSEVSGSTSVADALLLGDNSFWHIKIELDLNKGNVELLPHRILLEFSFVRAKDVFRVSLDHTGGQSDIDPAKKTDFKRLYDLAHQAIKDTFTNSATRLLKRSNVLEIDPSSD